MTKIIHGINYQHPEVVLLHASPLVNAELAGRVCYNSFENSEHEQVREFDRNPIEDVEHSELLDSLCHVYHHMSIAEHVNLTYLIKGTSRGVLQEHARHRIQAISVRSTRYTMSSIINAYIASKFYKGKGLAYFTDKLLSYDMFVTVDAAYQVLEIAGIYDKLVYQNSLLGEEEFNKLAVAKSSLRYLDLNISDGDTESKADYVFKLLQDGKKKRNVGDAFKHIVTDNWKVDMVVTFNLRSLKNYFTLRDSSSAYFQIRWLAQEMIKVTPRKYLDLILKKDKIDKILTSLNPVD